MTRRFDVPHAPFLCVIAGWSAWYFFDARAASGDIQNLGLIAPAAAIVVLLCASQLLQARETIVRFITPRILGTMALLGVYVLTMDRIGFDLATWLYVLGSLFLLGERRIWMLALIPLIFAAAIAYAFATLLQIPMPLLFGGAA